VEIASPRGAYIFSVNSDGAVTIQRVSQKRAVVGSFSIEPPGMLSWAPDEAGFFLNDGEGSGMSSTIRVFHIVNGKLREDSRMHRAAVNLYRRKYRCGPSQLDPDVWGLKWTQGAREVVLLVQPTVHQPCGPSGTFMSVVVDFTSGEITGQFDESATREHFRSVLPPGLKK
jgi:hypothetical protein